MTGCVRRGSELCDSNAVDDDAQPMPLPEARIGGATGANRGALKLVLVAFLLTVGGSISQVISCGPSARDRALSTTFASLNVASSAFLAYDRAHQADLVAQAPDKASAQAELTNYRARRAPVQDAFVAAYRGLTAALLLKDDVSLANVIQAAAIVAEELADLGVKVKP